MFVSFTKLGKMFSYCSSSYCFCPLFSFLSVGDYKYTYSKLLEVVPHLIDILLVIFSVIFLSTFHLK